MILRVFALFLSLALIWAPACHAQEALIYLHGDDRLRLDQLPLVFLEMAKVAQWNILPVADDSGDDDQRAFIGKQAARLRQEGFRKVYVAGASRGGWMALVAAALDNVDGVIGIAPTTTTDLLWQRNELARRLAMAKTNRIAVVFFDEDPREKVPRSETTRQALQQTRSAYMFVDRPPGLLGHSAGATGPVSVRSSGNASLYEIGSTGIFVMVGASFKSRRFASRVAPTPGVSGSPE